MKFKSKLFLAPMVEVSDASFRILCSKYGAGLTFVEMLSSIAIARKSENTLKLIDIKKNENPIGVQLMGNDIDNIKKAIRIVEKKADIIDFNMGCPVNNITNQGCGAALLKEPKKVKKILESSVEYSKKPISVKIRSGWDKKSINAVEIGKIAEKAGCYMVSVHGKTKMQDKGEKADWKIIKDVKDKISIPVVGNGGINKPEDVEKMFNETNCDYVMIAREASRNPYFFKQANDYLKKGSYDILIDEIRLKSLKEYLKLAKKNKPKFRYIKDHAMYMTKGIKNSKELRVKLTSAKNIEEIKQIIEI